MYREWFEHTRGRSVLEREGRTKVYECCEFIKEQNLKKITVLFKAKDIDYWLEGFKSLGVEFNISEKEIELDDARGANQEIFEIGDEVIGVYEHYSITGKGVVCKVVNLVPFKVKVVEGDVVTTFAVEPRYFKAKGKIRNKQKNKITKVYKVPIIGANGTHTLAQLTILRYLYSKINRKILEKTKMYNQFVPFLPALCAAHAFPGPFALGSLFKIGAIRKLTEEQFKYKWENLEDNIWLSMTGKSFSINEAKRVVDYYREKNYEQVAKCFLS